MVKKQHNKSAANAVAIDCPHDWQSSWKHRISKVWWLELNATIKLARLQTLKRQKYQNSQEQALVKARGLLRNRNQEFLSLLQDLVRQAQCETEIRELLNYTPEALALRFSLRSHPDVLDAIKLLWSVELPRDELGCIDQQGYLSLFRRIGRCLEPKQRVQYLEKMIQKDWMRDSQGEAVMSFASFFDSVFELVDLWCETSDVEEYVAFLRTLVFKVTCIHRNEKGEWSDGKRLLRSLKEIKVSDHEHISFILKKRTTTKEKEDQNPQMSVLPGMTFATKALHSMPILSSALMSVQTRREKDVTLERVYGVNDVLDDDRDVEQESITSLFAASAKAQAVRPSGHGDDDLFDSKGKISITLLTETLREGEDARLNSYSEVANLTKTLVISQKKGSRIEQFRGLLTKSGPEVQAVDVETPATAENLHLVTHSSEHVASWPLLSKSPSKGVEKLDDGSHASARNNKGILLDISQKSKQLQGGDDGADTQASQEAQLLSHLPHDRVQNNVVLMNPPILQHSLAIPVKKWRVPLSYDTTESCQSLYGNEFRSTSSESSQFDKMMSDITRDDRRFKRDRGLKHVRKEGIDEKNTPLFPVIVDPDQQEENDFANGRSRSYQHHPLQRLQRISTRLTRREHTFDLQFSTLRPLPSLLPCRPQEDPGLVACQDLDRPKYASLSVDTLALNKSRMPPQSSLEDSYKDWTGTGLLRREKRGDEIKNERLCWRDVKAQGGRGVTASPPSLGEARCSSRHEIKGGNTLMRIMKPQCCKSCGTIWHDEKEQKVLAQDVTVIVNATRKLVLRPDTIDRVVAKRAGHAKQATRVDMMRRRCQYTSGKCLHGL